MEAIQGVAVQYFLWSCVTGVTLALFYDLLRSLRVVSKASVFRINVEDMMFFFISGLALFFVSFHKNNGNLRFQCFWGVIIGFSIYRVVFRKRIVAIIVSLLNFIGKMIKIIWSVVTYPVRIVSGFLSKSIIIIGWYSRNKIKKIKLRSRVYSRERNVKRKENKFEHNAICKVEECSKIY